MGVEENIVLVNPDSNFRFDFAVERRMKLVNVTCPQLVICFAISEVFSNTAMGSVCGCHPLSQPIITQNQNF